MRPDSGIGGQFTRFAIVGVAGFLVDSAVLYVCLYALDLGIYGGRLVSYLLAATTTWFLNRQLTFRHSCRRAPLAQWTRFLVTNAVGGAVNYATYVAVMTLGPGSALLPLLGVAAGALAGLGFNFTASRRYVFRPVADAPPRDASNLRPDLPR